MFLDLLSQDGLTLKRVANTGGGEYAGPCPFCSGNDRFRVWPESGRYWCRGCGKSGDAIQYLRDYRGLSFPEAASLTGKETTATSRRPTPPPAWVPETPQAPPETWQTKATTFAMQAQERLWQSVGAKMRHWLHDEKGLSDETIKKAYLGYNPSDIFEPRATWGLTDGKKICCPAGLCIPTVQDGKIIRLKIRRRDPSEYGPYSIVSGSFVAPMTWGADKRAVVVVESELDGLLLSQEAGDLCAVVALGSAQANPDKATDELLRASQVILIALDTDEAGAKAAWDFWQKQYGAKFKRWPCVNGKDPSEARLNGLDLRMWIEAGLPDIPPEENKCPVANHDAPESSLQGKETPPPEPPPIDADDQELIDWFLTATLPTEAFDLDCARRVLDPAKFFDSLHREVAGRQSSPRWRCGATQADLRRLRTV